MKWAASFSTVGVALGALTFWHAVLISKGETSIERHINGKETKRMAAWGKVSACQKLQLLKNKKLNKGCKNNTDFCGDCQVYRNPYNHGRLNNWKLFLGVEKRRCVQYLVFFWFVFLQKSFHAWRWLLLQSLLSRHWVTRVLLPSGHSPHGDGMTWGSFPPKKDVIPVWICLGSLVACTRQLTVSTVCAGHFMWMAWPIQRRWLCKQGSTSNTSDMQCGTACCDAFCTWWSLLIWVSPGLLLRFVLKCSVCELHF